jgi:GTP cyclohydrolase II
VAPEVARAKLPTPYGTFQVHALECSPGVVYLALVLGEIGEGTSVLVRIHSQCLTGDALGSLRCDCGSQLRAALDAVAARGRGIVVYATDQEGRGIGLVNKLRAYAEQDAGADTVDANLHLGLPVDSRDYHAAAAVLRHFGVRSVHLLTNNPDKVSALRSAGIAVDNVVPLPVAPHDERRAYVETKQSRLGHVLPMGDTILEATPLAFDVTALLGGLRAHRTRPHVILKYAQSIDGRVATTSGDARWISSMEERAVSHALRARCDAIMVGIGTVLRDDPQLTVRLVAGQSPIRVVLDSSLRIPSSARVLGDDAATIVFTTSHSNASKRRLLRNMGITVEVVPASRRGLDVHSVLRSMRGMGIGSLLVEGGARVITSLLDASSVDRIIVALAPILMGKGLEGIGDLGAERVEDSIALVNRSVYQAGPDLLIASDVASNGSGNGVGAEIEGRTRSAALRPVGASE